MRAPADCRLRKDPADPATEERARARTPRLNALLGDLQDALEAETSPRRRRLLEDVLISLDAWARRGREIAEDGERRLREALGGDFVQSPAATWSMEKANG